ncbi:MAG: hypothetical protein GX791_02775 [Synergistaceae bacterium]|nr:hypothetical protein [Synergistaceae bacterium]
MNIPRIALAHEKRPGKVPQSILAAAALKNLGHPLKIFCAGPDEYLSRLAGLILGEDVTVLDPLSCGNARIFKTLFQRASRPDSLNIILVPLGERTGGDTFSFFPEGAEICRQLECPMVPVIYSDSSAGVASRIIEEMTDRFSGPGGISLPAVLFSSVLNPREYQLLEIETGRRSPLMVLGYIPATLERGAPDLLEMCLPDSSAKISLQVKTAAAQLGASAGQVDWNILWGVARFHDEWTQNPEPLKGKFTGLSVGIVDHEALRLEGDNARQLFLMFGCSVKMLDLQSRGEAGLNALYIPHGPGFLLAEHLLGNPGIKEWFHSFFRSRRGIFVNGGVTPLLGRSFSLPNDRQYEGMGIFPFRGKFELPSLGIRRVEISSREGDSVLNIGEKMRGHMPSCCSVLNPDDEAPSLWTLKEPGKIRNFGFSGWSRGKGIATDVCIQPWSNIEGMGRWLAFCKS